MSEYFSMKKNFLAIFISTLMYEAEKNVRVTENIICETLHYRDHDDYRFLLIWILFHTNDTNQQMSIQNLGKASFGTFDVVYIIQRFVKLKF